MLHFKPCNHLAFKKFTIKFLFFTDIAEVGRSTRAFSELAGRTESMVSDVVLTLVEMGKFP